MVGDCLGDWGPGVWFERVRVRDTCILDAAVSYSDFVESPIFVISQPEIEFVIKTGEDCVY
jgi:hypothetical protein